MDPAVKLRDIKISLETKHYIDAQRLGFGEQRSGSAVNLRDPYVFQIEYNGDTIVNG